MTWYGTTPIYYVNDRPHIGHCYTTLVADVAARFQRLCRGSADDVFFLTGTDEHAEKVVTAAAEHGKTAQQWADINAQRFREAFAEINCSNDDFIRTSEKRHTERVEAFIAALMKSGDVELGDYEGWFDPSQEEYVTESDAREHDFKSPVTGKPLQKRTERNYFFKLSKYADRLRAHIEANPNFIMPEARRNEVLGRIKQGLRDVPISRAITDENDPAQTWGVRMPGDRSHRIYVWIDALLNYRTAIDTPERQRFWPADVHFIAKDILWFHAVIWPCMLMAQGVELPGTIYSHSYWVAEGRKMSKSLGNFIDLPLLRGYMNRYSLDAVRWFLVTQGPLGANDADFAHGRFVEIYNAELANGVGNCASRVANMIAKYFDGKVPDPGGVTVLEETDWPAVSSRHVRAAIDRSGQFDLYGLCHQGLALFSAVDGYINKTAPFRLAKTIEEDPDARDRLSAILYHCAEAIRIGSLLLTPVMPQKMAQLQEAYGCAPAPGAALDALCAWGGDHGLKPGAPIAKGEALFMRADIADAPPEPVQ
ncbi:MAG: methionine--tRNA ligase [Phycisphaerales bacterium JB039]